MATRSPPPALARTIKSGLGRLAAKVVGPSTHLTEVAHRSPTRIIPMGSKSSVEKAGAALAAISSYGGGMVRGDCQDLHIEVGDGAKLGLVTQGATRIYRRSGTLPSSSIDANNNNNNDTDDDTETCRATLHATIGSNGLLVVAPDPLVPYSQSSFAQKQRFELDGPDASLVLVDWFSAGRVVSGERWDFDFISSRSALVYRKNGHDRDNTNANNCSEDPFLIEAVALDRRRKEGMSRQSSNDPFCFNVGPDARFDAFASVILHGPAVKEISKRFETLSIGLAGDFTRIRDIDDDREDFDETNKHDSLGGRVLLGFSKVEHRECDTGQDKKGDTHVARLATTSNEDMYRVLHTCMLPLKDMFGVEFYRDRIHGSSAYKQVNGIVRSSPNNKQKKAKQTETRPLQQPSAPRFSTAASLFDGHASWCALMLADSGLPTGSFAHSASIETASQLGLFGSPSDPDLTRVANYISAATRSAVQLTTPFVNSGHKLSSSAPEAVFKEWHRLDRFAHATLAANGPGCRASLDQGHGMLRVAIQWLEGDANKERLQSAEAVTLLRQIQKEIDQSAETTGHIGPLFGLIGGFLGLDSYATCRVLGYCTARDMISAAVRLNLVGPMAGVTVLDGTFEAVDEGVEATQSGDIDEEDGFAALMRNAATCSPVVESIHPTHDMLAVRLFRT